MALSLYHCFWYQKVKLNVSSWKVLIQFNELLLCDPMNETNTWANKFFGSFAVFAL